MKSNIKWIIGFGFLIWLIPFLASFPIIGLHEENRPLFESIMPLVLTIALIVFSVLFFKKVNGQYLQQGIFAGITWFVISIVIDLVLFLPDSPMQMSFIDYMIDIGITYLMIIFIPIGIGYVLSVKTKL